MTRHDQLFLAIIAAALSSTLWVLFDVQRQKWDLAECNLNLREINTWAHIYSTDHAGNFPPSVAHIVPTYLDQIPICPAAGSDTYSASFNVGPLTENEDVAQGFLERVPGDIVCRVHCSGHHHRIEEPDKPAFIW